MWLRHCPPATIRFATAPCQTGNFLLEFGEFFVENIFGVSHFALQKE